MNISSPGVRQPTTHLRPTAPIAERAVLPGDPGRALLLAQTLLTEPRMANHHRGLWGYTGAASDGAPLTIQSTGMGGPSAAIVLEELVRLGVRRAVRVGTCRALDGTPPAGTLVIAGEALARDGTSRALGAGPRVTGDGALTAAIATSLPEDQQGVVATADLFYGRDGDATCLIDAGAMVRDLETAALLQVARRRGIACACVLVIVEAGAGPLADDELRDAAERAGRAAVAALRG